MSVRPTSIPIGLLLTQAAFLKRSSDAGSVRAATAPRCSLLQKVCGPTGKNGAEGHGYPRGVRDYLAAGLGGRGGEMTGYYTPRHRVNTWPTASRDKDLRPGYPNLGKRHYHQRQPRLKCRVFYRLPSDFATPVKTSSPQAHSTPLALGQNSQHPRPGHGSPAGRH